MDGEQFFQIIERLTHTMSVGLNNDLDFVHLVTGEVIIVDVSLTTTTLTKIAKKIQNLKTWMMIQITKTKLFCLIILVMSSSSSICLYHS